jgi:hypothetical protein
MAACLFYAASIPAAGQTPEFLASFFLKKGQSGNKPVTKGLYF